MAGGPFRRLYPENGESIVFDGGLDNKYAAALIPDNESPDCLNVIFSNGAVATRDGAVRLNTSPCGTGVVFDGLYARRDQAQNETMIAFAGGTMYTLGSTTFVTVPSAQSVFTAGQRVCADFEENYMFMGNGGVTPYKWDGTLFTRHGVPAPTQTAVVFSGIAGSLTSAGLYQYAYTYVNSALVEGNMSPFTPTFTVSANGGGLSLSNIAVAPASFGIARRRIYRTVNGGATFEKVADISDNTTTTYADNLSDAGLGVAAPLTNGVPPNYSAIIYHANRLFMNDPANPNLVWYTEIGQPYTVKPTSFFKVGDNTTDLVRGFGVYNNSVVVFCDQSIWINFMPDPSTPSGWRQIKSLSPYGSKSPFGIVNIGIENENKLLFPAMQNKVFVGFAVSSGDTLDPGNTLLTVTTAGSELQSDRIEPDMFSAGSAYVSSITSIVYKNKAYISMTWGGSATTNNRMYLFDFSMSNIKKEQPYSWVPFTGLNATQLCVYSGKLYFASSTTNGFVYNIDGTGVYSDDGAAINSYYWTKEYSGYSQELNFTKDWRYGNILIDNFGTFFMNLLYRVDSDKGSGQATQINLNPGGSNWGTMVFGRDNWGGGSNQTDTRIFLGEVRGKRLQIRFDNQNIAGNHFRVHRMNLAYNVKGYR